MRLNVRGSSSRGGLDRGGLRGNCGQGTRSQPVMQGRSSESTMMSPKGNADQDDSRGRADGPPNEDTPPRGVGGAAKDVAPRAPASTSNPRLQQPSFGPRLGAPGKMQTRQTMPAQTAHRAPVPLGGSRPGVATRGPQGNYGQPGADRGNPGGCRELVRGSPQESAQAAQRTTAATRAESGPSTDRYNGQRQGPPQSCLTGATRPLGQPGQGPAPSFSNCEKRTSHSAPVGAGQPSNPIGSTTRTPRTQGLPGTSPTRMQVSSRTQLGRRC